jgi:hypothetical protein
MDKLKLILENCCKIISFAAIFISQKSTNLWNIVPTFFSSKKSNNFTTHYSALFYWSPSLLQLAQRITFSLNQQRRRSIPKVNFIMWKKSFFHILCIAKKVYIHDINARERASWVHKIFKWWWLLIIWECPLPNALSVILNWLQSSSILIIMIKL